MEVKEHGHVVIIGGANVDIHGSPEESLVMGDSNPGRIKTTLGGVGRNIAENCSLLGMNVKLVAAIGEDSDGDYIRSNALMRGIDLQHSLNTDAHRTSTYLYITDEAGEMIVAVNDMAIVNDLDVTYLEGIEDRIDKATVTVLEANLSQDTLEWLAKTLSDTILVFDGVSAAKVGKIESVIHRFDLLKLNRLEAERLSGVSIGAVVERGINADLNEKAANELTSDESVDRAAQVLIEKGAGSVVITLGAEGIYYRDREQSFFMKAIPVTVANVTGAGDAFTAALAYGLMKAYDKKALMAFAIGAAGVTLQSEWTIAEDLSVESVEALIKRSE